VELHNLFCPLDTNRVVYLDRFSTFIAFFNDLNHLVLCYVWDRRSMEIHNFLLFPFFYFHTVRTLFGRECEVKFQWDRKTRPHEDFLLPWDHALGSYWWQFVLEVVYKQPIRLVADHTRCIDVSNVVDEEEHGGTNFALTHLKQLHWAVLTFILQEYGPCFHYCECTRPGVHFFQAETQFDFLRLLLIIPIEWKALAALKTEHLIRICVLQVSLC